MACSELALAGRYNRVQAETEVRWPLTKKKRKTTRWAKAFGLGAGVCIRKRKPGENDAGDSLCGSRIYSPLRTEYIAERG